MNPLLQPSKLKNSATPFNAIKPEHFPEALDHSIALGKKLLKEIKSRNASFDNTLRGLEHATEEMEYVFTIFNCLVGAHSDEALQALAAELGPKVAAFANDILLDPEIFKQVEEVYNNRSKLALNAEQLRLVEKTYRDFERSGAGLNEKQKQRLREIDERLSQLSPKFRENTLKATNEFELWVEREADLAGLSESLRTAAREAAAEKNQPGKWLFTLHMPSYIPFMRFSENRELREKMFRATSSRGLGGKYDNQGVILEIVALMQEKSEMLGAKSYAHYALQLRMAETPEQVFTFLEKILQAALPVAKTEIEEIQKLANSMGGPNPIQAWDFHFYAEKLKEKMFTFDEEQLKPYFKLENVLNGVFEHARRLFGLTFEKSNEYPVYHEDVQVFEVYKSLTPAPEPEPEPGNSSAANTAAATKLANSIASTSAEREFIGLFFADFFPRASKQQGAWMTNFYEQGTFRGKVMRPHVSIVCNFTKPTADRPSLLGFDEVKTLFHEFGHALHGLLSKVEHRSLAGTNVFLDFVELPSQILENWAKEEESLKLFAFHYKTGETLPMELLKRLMASQKFLVGYSAVRQVNFALLDMAWFSEPPKGGETVPQFEERITRRTQLLPRVENSNISTGFGHIFGGGYASGYYSYKWAEALDADAFELFKEQGIFDQSTATRFEEFILSKGGSDHPMRLYEKFRGRAPDPEALLRRDGLL